MFVKVCGIRSAREIDWAVELGYSAVGVVLHPGSPRFMRSGEAAALGRYGQGRITTVAVALRYDDLKEAAEAFDFIQVYEKVDIGNLIYAGSEDPAGVEYRYFLYDKSRGSGEKDEIPSWVTGLRDRLIIAGGLDAGSVRRIIERFRPFGVDVSSGVEAPRGVKDYNLMRQFIHEVQQCSV